MQTRKPSILIPFEPSKDSPHARDVFVYLRPETNGIEVESLIMSAIRQEESCRDRVDLAYLANLPGDFISSRGLVEHHYRMRLLFALKGKALFTKYMRKAFKSYFKCSFDKAEILGSYDAMERLGLDAEGLFNRWVAPVDMLNLDGQSIKKIDNVFVLNYDMPAIMCRNNADTDIAVMIFRTHNKDEDINFMVEAIEKRLKEKGLIEPRNPASRIFHYSKGPFEEILDSSGFLYDTDLKNISLDEVAFGRYLVEHGITLRQIEGVLYNPIMCFMESEGKIVENDIFSYTRDLSYEEAYNKFKTVYSQRVIAKSGPPVEDSGGPGGIFTELV